MAVGFGNLINLPDTIGVNQGGIGVRSVTAYAPLAGGISTTDPLVSLSTGMSTAGNVLTTNGSSSFPTWQPPQGSASAVTSIVQTINTTAGSYTYTPTSGMVFVFVELIGGGGSGGTAQSTSLNHTTSGGGGGGGYIKALYSASDIGSSQSYTIGAGGVGSGSGNNGGDSYFISNAGAGQYAVAQGGSCGVATSGGYQTIGFYAGGNGGGFLGSGTTNFFGANGSVGGFGLFVGLGLGFLACLEGLSLGYVGLGGVTAVRLTK